MWRFIPSQSSCPPKISNGLSRPNITDIKPDGEHVTPFVCQGTHRGLEQHEEHSVLGELFPYERTCNQQPLYALLVQTRSGVTKPALQLLFE